MYCVKCGVKLADIEKNCPLCGTSVYHPELTQGEGEKTYPKGRYPRAEAHPLGLPIFFTVVFLIPFLITLVCDLQLNQAVTWSGYVIGALLLTYIILVLPTWFRSANPVIFVPCSFVAAGLYLLYINCATGGDWFLTFAFPITGCIGAIVTTVTVLLQYLKKGRFYIIGGALVALGAFALLVEFLLSCTFEAYQFVGWSFYTLVGMVLIGGYLIVLGFCRPARELMERKFFV